MTPWAAPVHHRTSWYDLEVHLPAEDEPEEEPADDDAWADDWGDVG